MQLKTVWPKIGRLLKEFLVTGDFQANLFKLICHSGMAASTFYQHNKKRFKGTVSRDGVSTETIGY
jgi:hypothetical protein